MANGPNIFQRLLVYYCYLFSILFIAFTLLFGERAHRLIKILMNVWSIREHILKTGCPNFAKSSLRRDHGSVVV